MLMAKPNPFTSDNKTETLLSINIKPSIIQHSPTLKANFSDIFSVTKAYSNYDTKISNCFESPACATSPTERTREKTKPTCDLLFICNQQFARGATPQNF